MKTADSGISIRKMPSELYTLAHSVLTMPYPLYF